MSADPQSLRDAAEAIRTAEGLVLMAEAEPDELRVGTESRQAYPGLTRIGETADPGDSHWFERDPSQAWGYYGILIDRGRQAAPVAGLAQVMRWAARMPRHAFVFTSCVDGRFQRGGLAEERVVECQGSLEHVQCAKPCCAATWPVPAALRLDIDPGTLRAMGELPRCVRCNGPARPNVRMAEDDAAWSSGRTLAQQVRYRAWLASLARGRFVVMALGPHTGESVVGRAAEQLAAAGRVALIAINPATSPLSPGVIPLWGRPEEVLQELADTSA